MTLTLTLFMISWILVGVATASLLTYLDYREESRYKGGGNISVGDVIIGTMIGIIGGYILIIFLIKGLIQDYDPPKFWNKIVWKSKEENSK